MSSQRDICLSYFTEISENKWKCRCGRELTQKKGSGWTNLLNHLKSQHPNYSDDASQLKISTLMPKNKMADLVLLMKYRHILTKHVEAEIQKTLPDKFALVMDG